MSYAEEQYINALEKENKELKQRVLPNDPVLNKVIEIKGADYQAAVAIEELSELTKEICKFKRGKGNALHLAEEMADVEIILEELKIMFDNKDMVDVWRQRKIDRLKERLNLTI